MSFFDGTGLSVLLTLSAFSTLRRCCRKFLWRKRAVLIRVHFGKRGLLLLCHCRLFTFDELFIRDVLASGGAEGLRSGVCRVVTVGLPTGGKFRLDLRHAFPG